MDCTRRQMLAGGLAAVGYGLSSKASIVHSSIGARQLCHESFSSDDMVEVEWIASDGDAWIDTGFVPMSGFYPFSMRCVLGTQFINTPFFGCSTTHDIVRWDMSKTLIFGFGMSNNDRRYVFKPKIQRDWMCWGTAYTGNEYYDGEMHEVDVRAATGSGVPGGYGLYVDDVQIPLQVTYNGAPVSTNSESIGLFCVKANGNAVYVTNPSVGFKLRSFAIGDLLLTAVRIGDIGYMYDVNSGTLLGNSGDGRLIVGPDL